MLPESLESILIVFTVAWCLFTPGRSCLASPLGICCDHGLIIPFLGYREEDKKGPPFQDVTNVKRNCENGCRQPYSTLGVQSSALWRAAGWTGPQQEPQGVRAVPGTAVLSVIKESSPLSGRGSRDCLRMVKQDGFWNLTILWNSLWWLLCFLRTLPLFHMFCTWDDRVSWRQVTVFWKDIDCFALHIRTKILTVSSTSDFGHVLIRPWSWWYYCGC